MITPGLADLIVTVTSFNAKRYFMTIRQACELIISVEGEKIGLGTYILDMGEDQSILELAKKMITATGRQYSFVPEAGKIEIKEIGLRKGEKEIEQLTHGRLCKTAINSVYRADEGHSPIDRKILNIIGSQIKSETVNKLLRLYNEHFN